MRRGEQETNGSVLRVNRAGHKSIGLVAMDDPRLSLKAKGLYTLLITRPDGWHFSVPSLIGMSQDGRYAVQSALRELEELGYLKREPKRVGDRLCGMVWTIYECPLDEGAAEQEGSRAGFLPG